MEIIIEGMSCMHCVNRVKEALLELEGVTNVDVSLEDSWAIVEGNAEEEEIRAALEEAGYDVIEIN
ncbi:MAG: heavy-metal-associated domain-containing protein [Cellulosilyticaceae bacterium]